MHIAILCEYGTVNGGENSILAMMEQLSECRFTVLAPPEGRLSDRLRELDVHHVALSLTAKGNAAGRSVVRHRLTEIIDTISPDLLHGNSLATGRLTGALSPMLSIPTSAHLRDILRLSGAAISELNQNDRLIAVSQATREFHVAQGLDPGRTHVVFNGVDASVFHSRQRTNWLIDELMLPESARLVGTIGQFSLRKGLDVLIEAAIQTAAELPDVHWLICGERYSAKRETVELEADLHRRVTAANLVERVHWLGYRDDIPMLLSELDVLVHPSRQEPLGRVLLEAAACAVPIVATTVGGTREILDENSAVLIAPDDPPALSDAVRRLLGDPRRCATIGAAARETILSRFRVEDRARELAGHWQQLITEELSSTE